MTFKDEIVITWINVWDLLLKYLPKTEIKGIVDKACEFADSPPTVQRCMAARMIGYLADVSLN